MEESPLLKSAKLTKACYVLLIALISLGCIWDSDTLDDELRGLPDAFSLVTGRWFQHSDAYYHARIRNLPAVLKANPDNLAVYDDLAVAYERIGNREAAIAMMKQKALALARTPNAEHQYRYHANLGTFLAHMGNLQAGVAELERAVEINPDAHFGRERIQIDVIRFVIEAKANPNLWSEYNSLTWAGYDFPLLAHNPVFQDLYPNTWISHEMNSKELKKISFDEAYQGVAAMIRFGGLEAPELYRILGDLFLSNRDYHLAWWSYQRAIERGHPAIKHINHAIYSIEEHWRKAGMHARPTLKDFAKVRQNADIWLANFHAAEEEALRQGEDTSKRDVLARLIAFADRTTPNVPHVGPHRIVVFWKTNNTVLVPGVVGGLALCALPFLLLRYNRQRRKTRQDTSTTTR